MSQRHSRSHSLRPLPMLLLAAAFGLIALGGCTSEQEIQISALHFFKLGNQALEREDYPKAIHAYRRVLALDDRAAAAHYNLGLALFEMQAHDQAAASFERALELYPAQPAAHYNLALTYDRLYNLPAAHAHYNKYRELVLAQDTRQAQAAAPARAQPRAGSLMTLQGPPTQAALGAGTAAAATTTGARAMGAPGARPPPPAQPRNPAPPVQVQPVPGRPAGAARTRETDEMLGGSDKWWIQDRFIQNQ